MSVNANTTTTLSPEYLNAYRGTGLLAVAIFFIPLLLIFVGLRFYCRHLTRTKWGVDDYLVLASLFCQIGASVIAICGVVYTGNGRHLPALEVLHPNIVVRELKWLLPVSAFYFFAVNIPKLAILAFYHRIFTIRAYHYVISVLAAITIATQITCTVMALNLCRPFAFNWDKSIPGGHCFDSAKFFAWGSFPNILTDIAVLILPVPIVWKLNTSTNMKIGLTLTFTLAGIGLIASIIRFSLFFGIEIQDITWGVETEEWTIAEPNIYLMANCLVTYRPLFKDFISVVDRVKSSFNHGTKNSTGPSLPPSTLKSNPEYKNRKGSKGFQKLHGRPIFGSLGNTFDMRDTLHTVVIDIDVETGGNWDEIQLLQMNGEERKGPTTTEQAIPNQIHIRNDFSVKSEQK